MTVIYKLHVREIHNFILLTIIMTEIFINFSNMVQAWYLGTKSNTSDILCQFKHMLEYLSFNSAHYTIVHPNEAICLYVYTC
jgi:hypothetical protein